MSYEIFFDDDGGVSVDDRYSFHPDTDYESEIAQALDRAQALTAARNFIASSADERVAEAATYLEEAWVAWDSGIDDRPDVFNLMAKTLLDAIDEGLV